MNWDYLNPGNMIYTSPTETTTTNCTARSSNAGLIEGDISYSDATAFSQMDPNTIYYGLLIAQIPSKGSYYTNTYVTVKISETDTFRYSVNFNYDGHGGTDFTLPVRKDATVQNTAVSSNADYSKWTTALQNTVTNWNANVINPTCAGYTFGGWYTDAEFTQAYNFTSAVTSEVNLYAKWTPFSGNISLLKTDENKQPLSGAVYGIYSDENCNTLVAEMEATDESGKSGYTGLLSGESGTTYYVKEITAPKGYALDTTVYSVLVEKDKTTDVNDGSVSDKELTGSVEIPVTKTLGGEEITVSDLDGKFTFELSGNGIQTQTVKNTGGKASIEINYSGAAAGIYTYTVKELEADGYICDKSVYAVTVEVSYGDDALVTSYTITKDGKAVNNITFDNIETTSVTVTKTWDDNNNQDGLRNSYKVTLLADGVKANVANAEVELDKDTLTYSWNDLPENEEGKTIVYTVEESSYPEGYTPTIENIATTDDTFAFSIKNTHVPYTMSVTVTKTWDDNNDQDGLRGSYKVTLLADGVKANVANAEVELDKDTLTHSWNDLPENANGKAIVYTVEESAYPEGYTPSIEKVDTEDESCAFSIVNTHEPEKIDIEGTKTWKDNQNSSRNRPNSITINLLADGTVISFQTVTSDEGWKWIFDGLDKYKDGQEIIYTITEDKVPGYETTVDGYNIINTYIVPEVPDTGDNSSLMLWLILSLLSSTGIVSLIATNISKKKRQAK